MSYLENFTKINKDDVERAGGKGASLGEMTQAGIPVPPGFILLAGAFDRFLAETNLKAEINSRLKEVNLDDINSVDRAGNIIRDLINDAQMPGDLVIEIYKAFDDLGAEYVAVRSSATAEDGAVASWAGELDTFLNTGRTSVVENVKKCWASLYTARAIFYRHEKNLIDHYVSVAVVVQKMVQSDISGIAFTVHPVTEDYNQMIIEAGYGLGEAVVSGQITPDSYIVGKNDLSILDISIGCQSKKLIKSLSPENIKPDLRNDWVELNKEEAEKQKLTGKQIVEVASICKKIEEHYGFPCDIEWAIENGVLYITQSRPITTLKK